MTENMNLAEDRVRVLTVALTDALEAWDTICDIAYAELTFEQRRGYEETAGRIQKARAALECCENVADKKEDAKEASPSVPLTAKRN